VSKRDKTHVHLPVAPTHLNAFDILLDGLNQRPLKIPIVADPLGKLYNKDAIIEYLLDRSTYGDGDQIPLIETIKY
jgi:hypothetical protein